MLLYVYICVSVKGNDSVQQSINQQSDTKVQLNTVLQKGCCQHLKHQLSHLGEFSV